MIKTKEAFDKFQNFIHAFGATRLLLQRAHEHGFLIEGMVLYASLVDGFCRICIVLKEQLDRKTDTIDEKYIYQSENNRYIQEKQIYKLIREKKIISKKLFDELNNLYNIRNKMIHRFFISKIEYSHLEIVCNRYEQVYKRIRNITNSLESEQVKKGVGMTKLDKYTESDKLTIKKDIYKKIKSGSEKALAKTLGCVSVEEVIEFGSKNGFFQKCKTCNHSKIEHFDIKAFKLNGDKVKKLDDYFDSCNSKGCKCKKYENAN